MSESNSQKPLKLHVHLANHSGLCTIPSTTFMNNSPYSTMLRLGNKRAFHTLWDQGNKHWDLTSLPQHWRQGLHTLPCEPGQCCRVQHVWSGLLEGCLTGQLCSCTPQPKSAQRDMVREHARVTCLCPLTGRMSGLFKFQKNTLSRPIPMLSIASRFNSLAAGTWWNHARGVVTGEAKQTIGWGPELDWGPRGQLNYVSPQQRQFCENSLEISYFMFSHLRLQAISPSWPKDSPSSHWLDSGITANDMSRNLEWDPHTTSLLGAL